MGSQANNSSVCGTSNPFSNLLTYLVQLRWQWRIHSTFFPSVSQLASQCQSHHGSCSTIDIDQICPVCDLSPGSNVRTDSTFTKSQQPVLELPFPRKVETALFYHKPHLDLPGMRTGTQPVLRKERVATWCIVDYFCVLDRILHTIIAHTLYVLKKALAERFKTKCWLQKYGKPSLHQLWGIAVAAVACSLVVAIAPWQIILDGWRLARWPWKLFDASKVCGATWRRCPKSTWSSSSLGFST